MYHVLEIVSKIVLVLASRRTVLDYTTEVVGLRNKVVEKVLVVEQEKGLSITSSTYAYA